MIMLHLHFSLSIVFMHLFYFQCRIEGITYVAAGNSTNKKDAQSNAANDMCQYLVRTGQMRKEDVPNLAVS